MMEAGWLRAMSGQAAAWRKTHWFFDTCGPSAMLGGNLWMKSSSTL
jgi:hypothetical protein